MSDSVGTDTVIAPLRPSAHLLDPEVAAGMAKIEGFPARPDPTLAEMQARAPDLVVEQREIPGMPGQPDVTIVILSPRDGKPRRPGLLSIHGGGYMQGNALQEAASLATYVQALGCTGIAVDYRLAPGTPFPGSLLDNYAALAWFHDNAAALNVDPARIAIMGGSAGGGHAAMLSYHARNEGRYPILMQYLAVPMLDDRTGATIDPGPYAGEFVWTREMNKMGWSALLGVPAGSPDIPVGASPGRFDDLAGLPPTLISVGTLDVLVQEGLAFAARLVRAGVPTELHLWDGMIHGGQFYAPDGRLATTERAVIISAMRAAFDRGPRPQPAG